MLQRLTTSLAASRLLATAFCTALADVECRLAASLPALAAGESWLMNLTMRAIQMFFIAFH
jgi:hypothetical protein